jgi:hypothetical protein
MNFGTIGERIEMMRINRRTDFVVINMLNNDLKKLRRQLIRGYINRDEYECERNHVKRTIQINSGSANVKSQIIARLQRMM